MILFHDVDGCLNAEDGNDLPMAENAYSPLQTRRLSELGQQLDNSPVRWLAINTGRALADTQTLAPIINSKKLRFLIVEHGALIIDLHTDASIEWSGAAAVKLTDVQKLVSWFHREGLRLFSRRLGHELQALKKIANVTIALPPTLDADFAFAELRRFVDEESPFDADDYIYHYSGTERYIDIMSTIHKGDGVQRIMELADGKQSIAVGNGLNDLPMMEVVDLCVCPSNSEPELIDCVRRHNGIVGKAGFIHTTLAWLQTLS